MKSLCVLALALGAAFPAASQQSPAPARAEVLVLGVYHMANPGHDIFNMQADDVLAPKRKAEMAQLIEALKKIPADEDRCGSRLWQRPNREALCGLHGRQI